jgi:hypothetical protein
MAERGFWSCLRIFRWGDRRVEKRVEFPAFNLTILLDVEEVKGLVVKDHAEGAVCFQPCLGEWSFTGS